MIIFTYCPDPIGDVGRRTFQYKVNDSDLLQDQHFSHLIQLQPCRVWINDKPVKPDEVNRVKDGDIIVCRAVARAEIGAAVFALIDAYASQAVIAFLDAAIPVLVEAAVSAAVNFGVQAISKAISGGESSNSVKSRRSDPDTYGLSNGSNAYRPLQPLPIVLGRHRMYPDFDGRIWTDYPLGGEVYTVINDSPRFEPRQALPLFFSSATNTLPISSWTAANFNSAVTPWTFAQGGGVAPFSVSDWVDNQPRTYNDPTGSVTVPHTFVMRMNVTNPSGNYLAQSWLVTTYESYSTGIPDWIAVVNPNSPPLVDVIVGYGFEYQEHQQRLNAILNFGYGDLSIVDWYVGTSPMVDYPSTAIQPGTFTNFGAAVEPWQHVNYQSTTGFNSNIPWPTNVETEVGAKLSRPPGEDGIWIERQTAREFADYLEIDIVGRLFNQGGNGPYDADVELEAQYALVGTNAWTPFPGLQFIRNGDITPIRNTYGASVPVGHYKVRVRLLTEDSQKASLVQEIAFESHRAFGISQSNYVGQNRYGFTAVGDERLQGSIDRISVVVSAKTWICLPLVYDGSTVGDSSWFLAETSNPAWWYLYLLLGGFENPTDPKGWQIGQSASSGQRLFGAGIKSEDIDLTSIVAWARRCDFLGIKFDGVVDQNRPLQETLDLIARIGRASRSYSAGKHGVVWDDVNDQPVQMFGMGNIIANSFSIAYGHERIPDEIVCTYADSNFFYQPREVRAKVPGVGIPQSQSTVNLWGCTSKAQATREANLLAAEQVYFPRRISFETDLDGCAVRRKDVVLLAHDLTQWAYSGRLMAITGSQIKLDSDIENCDSISIRLNDGTFHNSAISPTTVSRGNWITLTTPIPANQLPATTDENGSQNFSSVWPNSVPDDYVYHAGPSQVGIRARVLSVTPIDEFRTRLLCTDDSYAYFAHDVVNNPPAYVPDVSAEQLVARVKSAVWSKRADGTNVLTVETENSAWVTLTMAGTSIQIGHEFELPSSLAGSAQTILLTPIAGASAVGVVPMTITYTP